MLGRGTTINIGQKREVERVKEIFLGERGRKRETLTS